MLMNINMPSLIGIFIFISRDNFMLSSAEQENSFITSGPGLNTEIKIKEHSKARQKNDQQPT